MYRRIVHSVHVDRSLTEPFSAKDIRRIIPGHPYAYYFSFLAYNCTANISEKEALFIRVGRGRYRLSTQEHGKAMP